MYLKEKTVIDFPLITAGEYSLRVIYDENGNGKWDSGKFLQGKQPERVSYYTEKLDVRAGWELVYEFTLLD